MFVRLETKADVDVLSNTITENPDLKDTIHVTVPKIRKPRVAIYDIPNDVDGTDVLKAAHEQAGVDADALTVKFPINGKDATHWVILCSPKSFHVLLGLKRLKVGWTHSKIAEHLRVTQCY